MNKSLLLILPFFLFSVCTFAEDTVILLRPFNARGEPLKAETAIASADSLMINGGKLSPAQVMADAGHVKKISEFKTSSSIKTCEAGRFEHILKKGKLVKKETGCLESDRYQELKASFKALAKDPLLN